MATLESVKQRATRQMPCGYHINADEGLITLTGSDRLDLTRMHRVTEKLLADPSFEPSLPHLIDLRGARVVPHLKAWLRLRRYVLQEYRSQVGSSVAVVVDDSLDRMSLAGLYRLVANVPKAELFDSFELALRWLMRREFV